MGESNVTPLIDLRQERFAQRVADLIHAGRFEEAMQEIAALSERTARRAKPAALSPETER